MEQAYAHRPLSSSFLGLPCRILNISHKKELLRGLRVEGHYHPAPFREDSSLQKSKNPTKTHQRIELKL